MKISLGWEQNIRHVKETLRYLEISVPSDFEENARKNIAAHEKRCQSINNYVVSQVIRIADFWKPALATKEEYDKFVVAIIYRLYKNQCIALNNNAKCSELYIGRFAKLSEHPLAKAPDMRYISSTRLSIGGKAIINE